MQSQRRPLPARGRDARSPAAHAHRRGMTLLEVVFAVALLSIVAASAASVFGFVTAMQLRERQRLAAAEVAHRLVLNYLDDPTAMPNPRLPVEYGPADSPARFRWEYTEDPIVLHEVAGHLRDTTRQSPLSADRFMQVSVRVWLSEESGGTRSPEPGTPSAVLSRMIDPIYIRNPDSAMNMINSEAGRERWMQQLMGFTNNTQTSAGVPGGGRSSAGAGPRSRRESTRSSGSAREAFQRGRAGGGRVPTGEVGMYMSRMGGSFDAADFNSGGSRGRGGRR